MKQNSNRINIIYQNCAEIIKALKLFMEAPKSMQQYCKNP